MIYVIRITKAGQQPSALDMELATADNRQEAQEMVDWQNANPRDGETAWLDQGKHWGEINARARAERARLAAS